MEELTIADIRSIAIMIDTYKYEARNVAVRKIAGEMSDKLHKILKQAAKTHKE